MARRLGVAVLIVALAVVAGLARGALVRVTPDDPEDADLLYLPNGKYLKVMSLGHANLVADFIYLWAIQYYAEYDREHRQRYVEHVFANVITELDPHYIDAYWIGALILIIEAEQFEAGLRLLELGAGRNPDSWILPYLAGWECYHAGQPERAHGYFERASRVPDAPAVVQRMRAGLDLRFGETRAALATWQEILADPNSDPLSVKIAHRKVRQLRTRVGIELLTAALERFRKDNGHWPRRLDELVARSYIRQLPRDPDGREFVYDARTGRVSSIAGRVLGGN